jgi:tRNA uridine 5-carboxymethylaminomethyl modification enzyme
MFHVEQSKHYKLLVIGGGHAGVEATYLASKYLDRIALISLKGIGLASAPCNPCIGGVGKGQVVRELDALGGLMPKLADKAGIQYRTLNESKGYAVRSTRVQIDKVLYSKYAEDEINALHNVDVIRDKVSRISLEDGIYVVSCGDVIFSADQIIITVGTFLNGKLHVGSTVNSGGRIDSESVDSLGDIFANVSKVQARFKTGTPARLNRHSIDYTKLDEQLSDVSTSNFHYGNYLKGRNLEQVSCYLAYTNSRTLKIIRDNKEKSPMYNGQIKAVGARYCPSVEDKAYRYPDKDIHHVFIEPESHSLNTVYPSGISTSLPEDVQDEFVKTIVGLEDAKIEVYGYAVEYDVVDTTKLSHSLEYKSMPGLYFAGQVNGTSGYEEAAGQGFVAALNACQKQIGSREIHFSRKDSYIGVMVEDLISNQRDEPYRLFTARSENRLLIREDNAVVRMYKYRKSMNLYDDTDKYQDKFISNYLMLSKLIESNYLNPADPILSILTDKADFPNRISVKELLQQSWLNPIEMLTGYLNQIGLDIDQHVINCIAIEAKYSGYIDKSINSLEKLSRLDDKRLNIDKILKSENVSFECKQRIKDIHPQTFGQLKLMDGIRQASLAAIAAGL